MLRTSDVRAFRDPEFGYYAILVARAAVEALVAFCRRVYFGYSGLADRAGEDDLFN